MVRSHSLSRSKAADARSISAHVEAELAEAVEKAAELANLKPSGWIRLACLEKLARDRERQTESGELAAIPAT